MAVVGHTDTRDPSQLVLLQGHLYGVGLSIEGVPDQLCDSREAPTRTSKRFKVIVLDGDVDVLRQRG
jgi:hypothetical protein